MDEQRLKDEIVIIKKGAKKPNLLYFLFQVSAL